MLELLKKFESNYVQVLYNTTYSELREGAAEMKAKSQIIIILCRNLPVLSTLAKLNKTVRLSSSHISHTHIRRIRFLIKHLAQRYAMGNFCAEGPNPRSPPPHPHKTFIQNFLTFGVGIIMYNALCIQRNIISFPSPIIIISQALIRCP